MSNASRPQYGVDYPIKLGASFSGNGQVGIGTNIVSISSIFRPASVDCSRPAAMQLSHGRVNFEYHAKKDGAPPYSLIGNYATCDKSTDCILVFDPQEKIFSLEKLSATITNVNASKSQLSLLKQMPEIDELPPTKRARHDEPAQQSTQPPAYSTTSTSAATGTGSAPIFAANATAVAATVDGAAAAAAAATVASTILNTPNRPSIPVTEVRLNRSINLKRSTKELTNLLGTIGGDDSESDNNNNNEANDSAPTSGTTPKPADATLLAIGDDDDDDDDGDESSPLEMVLNV